MRCRRTWRFCREGRPRSSPARPLFYVVQRAPALTGNDLRSARQALDEFNRPAVGFTLKPDAARRFGAITERNINRPLATVLDNRVMSVATIQSRIDDQGQIAGVSREEMIEQVINLNSGALPADLEYVEERTVGASLGAASIRAGVLASLGGLGLVLLFMLSYYRLAGVNALISVVLNLLILLALMAYIPVTLTLPGIAGLILTIGMGVDSNVLIFERIKEELATARGPRSAVKAAFTRVWLTIVDTHVTSLIAAAFLFQFGTTPIRGFATTLAIGLLANVFTAVFVSRTLFEVALDDVRRLARWASEASQLFANARVNFTRWRWHALVLSLIIIGAGVATVVDQGRPAWHRLHRRHAGGRGIPTGRRDRGAGASCGFGIAGRCGRAALRRPCRPPVHDSTAARVIGQRRLGGHGPTDRAGVDGHRACPSSRSKSASS